MSSVSHVIGFCAVLFSIWGLPKLLPSPKHRFNRRKARLELNQIRQLTSIPEIYYHVRSVDPFVFEELILLALKDAGHKVRHNTRYTGDGGIDGRCKIRGKRFLIQVKRYRGYVDPQHIASFDRICSVQKCRGLFVHTGKTGKASRSKIYKNINIISGHAMLKLLLHGFLESDLLN